MKSNTNASSVMDIMDAIKTNNVKRVKSLAARVTDQRALTDLIRLSRLRKTTAITMILNRRMVAVLESMRANAHKDIS